MSQSQSSASTEPVSGRKRRSGAILAAFLIGLPLTACILGVHQYGLLKDTPLQRYFVHPVEQAEVLMFCAALGIFAMKFLRYLGERAACRRTILPSWDGKPVPVARATELQAEVNRLPRRLQGTYLVRRVCAVLDFLRRRGSATELDDQLRGLADNDAIAVEESYALVRFITWAIPILGFLGTVLGITEAIAGVTPEVLDKDLSRVTEGLATAFDTTALALTLTMVTMFLSFLLERGEQGVLQVVDQFADGQLAHRFDRTSAPGGEAGEVVRENSLILLGTMEKLVQGQANVWARALAEVDQRQADAGERMQQRLAAALEKALERTLEAHTRRLAALEQKAVDQGAGLVGQLAAFAEMVSKSSRDQQALLAPVAQSLTEQAEALVRVQEGGKQLVQLQEALHQNLATLTSTGAFEEAVHSLTAAIHLLTSRTAVPPSQGAGRGITRPGAAA